MTEVAKLEKEGYYWPQEEKEKFVADYVLSGNLRESSTKLGVSYDVAKSWHRQEWFTTLVSQLEGERNRAMAKRLAKVLDLGVEKIEDLLENGEERVTKDGDVVSVKAPLASVVMATGTLFDKIQVLKKNPDRGDSTEDILTRLADKLRSAITKPIQAEVIDVEFQESKA